jgi:hypothetical protein
MAADQLIEEIITREVRGLCTTCIHAETCAYSLSSTKTIIQCELFQLDQAVEVLSSGGLCKTCDQLSTCRLPGRRTGVWHCDEFL